MFKVYANSRAIAGKASGIGKSAAAFPDVCFSPPGNKPGIPIPYPNTAFISNLENESKTVLFYGQGCALRDVSRIATSTGDEPATMVYNKGIRSGVIKGKAYFTSWSPNVFVEGYNVPRHDDTMSHNHKS